MKIREKDVRYFIESGTGRSLDLESVGREAETNAEPLDETKIGSLHASNIPSLDIEKFLCKGRKEKITQVHKSRFPLQVSYSNMKWNRSSGTV